MDQLGKASLTKRGCASGQRGVSINPINYASTRMIGNGVFAAKSAGSF
jgi:hypothetical protein